MAGRNATALAVLFISVCSFPAFAQESMVVTNPLTGKMQRFIAPQDAVNIRSTDHNNCDTLAGNPIERIDSTKNYLNTFNIRPHASSLGDIKYINAFAIRACLRAAELFWRQPRNIYQLGRAQDADGNWRAAINSYEKAKEAGHPFAAYNLFFLQYEKANAQERERLRSEFRKEAEAGNKWLQAQYARAMLYGYFGIQQKPREGFQRLSELEPDRKRVE